MRAGSPQDELQASSERDGLLGRFCIHNDASAHRPELLRSLNRRHARYVNRFRARGANRAVDSARRSAIANEGPDVPPAHACLVCLTYGR